jgi:four helix bundle protein
MKISSYRDLRIWQRSMDLIVEIHRVTSTFPVTQRYILSAQMQRAALSIASNIAEGRGRWGCREFAHGLSIANGSLKELETQVLVSERLGFTEAVDAEALMVRCAEIGQMLTILRRRLVAR